MMDLYSLIVFLILVFPLSTSENLKYATFKNVTRAICKQGLRWNVVASITFVNAQYPFELFAINAENHYQVVLLDCKESSIGIFRRIKVVNKFCVNESDAFYIYTLFIRRGQELQISNIVANKIRKKLCDDQLLELQKAENTTMEVGQVNDGIWYMTGRNGDEKGVLVLGIETMTDKREICLYVDKVLDKVRKRFGNSADEMLFNARVKRNKFRNRSHDCPTTPLIVSNSSLCHISQGSTLTPEISVKDSVFEWKVQVIVFLVLFIAIVIIVVLCEIKS